MASFVTLSNLENYTKYELYTILCKTREKLSSLEDFINVNMDRNYADIMNRTEREYLINESDIINWDNIPPNFIDDLVKFIPYVYFITITYDPKKFSISLDNQLRIDLITYHYLHMHNKSLIHSIMTSFELTKNGIIHSHSIVHIPQAQVQQVRTHLINVFSYNHRRASIAVDIQPCKSIEKAHAYLLKNPISTFTLTTQYEPEPTNTAPKWYNIFNLILHRDYTQNWKKWNYILSSHNALKK